MSRLLDYLLATLQACVQGCWVCEYCDGTEEDLSGNACPYCVPHINRNRQHDAEN